MLVYLVVYTSKLYTIKVQYFRLKVMADGSAGQNDQ